MKSMASKFFLLASVALLLASCPSVLGGAGTNPRIKEIFIGRCWDKVQSQGSQLGINPNLDCEQLYYTFLKTFRGKNPADITADDFQPFLRWARHIIPRDQALLWTGSTSFRFNRSDPSTMKDIVHEYSDKGLRYWTLEDTLWGTLFDGLNFCGADSDSGHSLNYTVCPDWDNDYVWKNSQYHGSFFSYWPAASAQFASMVSGNVRMLAFAPLGKPLYRPPTKDTPGSVFATVEIFHLNASQIDSFEIQIIPSHGMPNETCGQGSVVDLVADLTRIAGIPAEKVSCVIQPPPLRHLLCVDRRKEDPQCQFAQMLKADHDPLIRLDENPIIPSVDGQPVLVDVF